MVRPSLPPRPPSLPPPPSRGEGGYVLVTALVFLAILTMVAVNSMQNTTMEQKISANAAFEVRALESSEGGRGVMSEVLDNHVFYRGWPSNANPAGSLQANLFTMPSGLTLRDQNGDSVADNLYEDKAAAGYANRLTDYNVTDAAYGADLNADGSNDLAANLYVYRLGLIQAAGAGAAMMSGYEGTGKGSAASGGQILYDIRSRSLSGTGGARSMTGSDYRHVIRN
ncbi:MAG: pilus assembly PilX N-terminal domain-containing protein [Magnetococcales bacterium]|nr:pilus assembly PilX N-terminal domain-containing protein [Magnetococcales bacterium]